MINDQKTDTKSEQNNDNFTNEILPSDTQDQEFSFINNNQAIYHSVEDINKNIKILESIIQDIITIKYNALIDRLDKIITYNKEKVMIQNQDIQIQIKNDLEILYNDLEILYSILGIFDRGTNCVKKDLIKLNIIFGKFSKINSYSYRDQIPIYDFENIYDVCFCNELSNNTLIINKLMSIIVLKDSQLQQLQINEIVQEDKTLETYNQLLEQRQQQNKSKFDEITKEIQDLYGVSDENLNNFTIDIANKIYQTIYIYNEISDVIENITENKDNENSDVRGNAIEKIKNIFDEIEKNTINDNIIKKYNNQLQLEKECYQKILKKYIKQTKKIEKRQIKIEKRQTNLNQSSTNNKIEKKLIVKIEYLSQKKQAFKTSIRETELEIKFIQQLEQETELIKKDKIILNKFHKSRNDLAFKQLRKLSAVFVEMFQAQIITNDNFDDILNIKKFLEEKILLYIDKIESSIVECIQGTFYDHLQHLWVEYKDNLNIYSTNQYGLDLITDAIEKK